ncbi:MAG: hypothetical protein GY820_08320 [Gammaproteobacteria bacterium]|nr:hypothetical protein [Gammaproteobacteria bacterium]
MTASRHCSSLIQTQTTAVELHSKSVGVRSNEIVELLLLDTSGSDLYENLAQKCWPKSAADSIPCLVYDITDRQSFDRLQYWYDKLQRQHVAKGAPGM